jgi:hypothetical protein
MGRSSRTPSPLGYPAHGRRDGGKVFNGPKSDNAGPLARLYAVFGYGVFRGM